MDNFTNILSRSADSLERGAEAAQSILNGVHEKLTDIRDDLARAALEGQTYSISDGLLNFNDGREPYVSSQHRLSELSLPLAGVEVQSPLAYHIYRIIVQSSHGRCEEHWHMLVFANKPIPEGRFSPSQKQNVSFLAGYFPQGLESILQITGYPKCNSLSGSSNLVVLQNAVAGMASLGLDDQAQVEACLMDLGIAIDKGKSTARVEASNVSGLTIRSIGEHGGLLIENSALSK